MQPLINGLTEGLAIALLATAFQLVHLPTRVFFLAQAGLYAIAPYLFLTLRAHGVSWPVGAAVTLVAVAAIGVLLEIANHRPLNVKGASQGAHLVSSLGAYVVAIQLIALGWGDQSQAIRSGPPVKFEYSWGVLTYPQSVILVIGGGLVIALLFSFRRFTIALRLRALADNPSLFAFYGHNIDRYRLVAFGSCGLITAAISLLSAYETGFDPNTGMGAFLLAVVAVIMGGRSSFVGPIAGGLLLGLSRDQVAWHLSAKWQDAATFVILIVFLLLRPEGLFVQRSRVEATQ